MGYMDAFLLLDDFFSGLGVSRWIYIPAFWMLMLVMFFLTAQLPAFVISWQAKARKILILGPMNSGKTSMVLSMKRGSFTPSVRGSQKANVSTFCPLTDHIYKSMTFVDVPGDSRVRVGYAKHLDRSVKGIVFVVDSANFEAQRKDAGEFLYQLLTDAKLVDLKVPILVAAAKSDESGAVPAQAVADALLNELTALRKSKGSSLSDISSDAPTARRDLPADKSGRFTAAVSPVPLSFTAFSTKNRDWEDVEEFVMAGAFRK